MPENRFWKRPSEEKIGIFFGLQELIRIIKNAFLGICKERIISEGTIINLPGFNDLVDLEVVRRRCKRAVDKKNKISDEAPIEEEALLLATANLLKAMENFATKHKCYPKNLGRIVSSCVDKLENN